MKNTTQQLLKVTGLVAKTGKVYLEIKNVYKYSCFLYVERHIF